MRKSVLAVFLGCLMLHPVLGFARTTVVVIPLTTQATQEYQWIGSALASALTMQVAMQPELNTVSLRQVNAAVRHEGLEGKSLSELNNAVRLGKMLGADLVVTGSYTAVWPDISLSVITIDPNVAKIKNTYTIDGGLDDLFTTEVRLAQLLAKELGADTPKVSVGSFGTSSLRAWRNVTLAHATLDWQSLGPQAADPNIPLALPKAAVEQAKAQLLEATKYDADYGEAWAALGVTQALLGDTPAAWKSLGKATALGFGHHPTAVVGASFVRMREARFDDAAKILESAIARYPGFLHARGYLGELYNHLGRHREALKVFDDYANVAPHQPWVLSQRGYTKSKLGDRLGAIADTVLAVDLVPDAPSLLIELASRYIDAGKLIGAEDTLLQAMKLHPDDMRIYVRLGYVYLLEEKDDLAIPISEKALVQSTLAGTTKDRAYAHLNLARAYGHKGDLDRAFDHLTQAKHNGQGSFAEVDSDVKLEALRKDARYQKLVN